MVEMTKQAEKFGAVIEYETIKSLNHSTIKPLSLVTSSGAEHEYESVILAMGASPRLLGVGEEKYWGRGFSTCAVCDAPFYRGKKVYVVGGGDAAIEDALALTKFASEVTLVVRRDKLRASVIMQKRILDNPKVKILWSSRVEKINGEEKIESVVINEQVVETEGLFFAIGHIPATGFLKNTNVNLDENGYIKILNHLTIEPLNQFYPTMTSVEGVFAAGDCVDHRYRQAVTAAGMGVAAALDCERWLEAR
jgi:thioredoxin reductase (NADPH)